MQSRNSRLKVTKAENQKKAIELRKAGFGYKAIAENLGVSLGGAFKLVKGAMAELRELTAEDAADVREMELNRLDDLLRGVWTSARSGNGAAIDRALRIMERRSKLLGLDAPTKNALTNPDGTEERTATFTFPVPPTLDPEAWAQWAQSLKPSP